MYNQEHNLLILLAKNAYQYNIDGFTLISGIRSNEYIDCKQALSLPEVLPFVGKVFLSKLIPKVKAIGGLTMGADPIAIATSYESAFTHQRIKWFCVRKDYKKHGRRRLIEGNIDPGMNVAIIDDVVTSGSSTIEAIEKCQNFGLNIVQVLILVDREVGGIYNIKKSVGQSVPVMAIFTKTEVRKEYEKL